MAETEEVFYVTGGRRNNESFSLDRLAYCYEAGLYRVDFGKKRITKSYFERDLNEDIYVPDYTLSFRGGYVNNDELITCTHSEIIIFDRDSFDIKRRISDRSFNDLHCVFPGKGKIWFTSTGINMVGHINGEGATRMYPAIAGAERKYQDDQDYRCICTKPHESHPNFLFSIDGHIWVTRFNQKDAVCLQDHSLRIEIEIERPHDGIVQDERVYFTTVDGNIVEVDCRSRDVIRVHNLSALYNSSNIGWCRGLVLKGDYAYVGFTAIRKTRSAENLSFLTDAVQMVGDRLKSALPARIIKYNLKKERIEDEMRFRPSEIGVIFSILK